MGSNLQIYKAFNAHLQIFFGFMSCVNLVGLIKNFLSNPASMDMLYNWVEYGEHMEKYQSMGVHVLKGITTVHGNLFTHSVSWTEVGVAYTVIHTVCKGT